MLAMFKEGDIEYVSKKVAFLNLKNSFTEKGFLLNPQIYMHACAA